MKFLCKALVAGSLIIHARSFSSDCDIHWARTSEPGRFPHAIPVSNPSGFAVVWEQDDTILLKQYDSSCKSHGSKIEVFRNSSLWTQSEQNGLAAAVGVGKDAVAVAWILGQDVWVKVVYIDGRSGNDAVLVSEKDGNFKRAEVRLVANPKASTATPVPLAFVAVWSSWRQDGWGVFARPFDARGNPVHNVTQVNMQTKGFQWQPQIAWCGNMVWALWANRSGEKCGSQGPCTTGPYIRALTTRTGAWESGPKEFALNGDGGQPLAEALSCHAIDSNEAVVLVFKQRSDSQYLNRLYVNENGPRPEATERRLRSLQGSDYSWQDLEMIKQNFQWLHGLATPTQPTLGALGVADATPSLQPGQVALLASDGLLLIMASSDQGITSARLVDFRPRIMAVYPLIQLALGAWNVRAAWEEEIPTGRPEALLLCYSTGNDFEEEDPSIFRCSRRTVGHLINPRTLGWGVELATTLALGLVVVACCMGHCLQQGRRRLPLARLGATGTRTSRAVRRGTTRRPPSAELRSQLARIPTAPVQPQPDPCRSGEQEMVAGGGSGGENAASQDQAPQAKDNRVNNVVCPICQNEVAMRVAFQPCGHTACRDCVHQLIERGHTCHICRAPLEGVLPVYI